MVVGVRKAGNKGIRQLRGINIIKNVQSFLFVIPNHGSNSLLDVGRIGLNICYDDQTGQLKELRPKSNVELVMCRT